MESERLERDIVSQTDALKKELIKTTLVRSRHKETQLLEEIVYK